MKKVYEKYKWSKKPINKVDAELIGLKIKTQDPISAHNEQLKKAISETQHETAKQIFKDIEKEVGVGYGKEGRWELHEKEFEKLKNKYLKGGKDV